MKNRNALTEAVESRVMMSASGHETAREVSHTGSGDGSGHPGTNPPPAVTVPARPTGLTASAAGTTVSLAWSDNSSNESGFAVFRLVKGQLTAIGTVPANTTTFSDTAAPAGSDVYVVRAVNTAGRSEGSNAATVKVTAPVPLLAPRMLRTAAVSSKSIQISWSGDSGATAFIVERSADGKTGWTPVGTTAATVRSFTDTGLTAATKYFYHVIAVGGDAHTATSTAIPGMTKRSDAGEPGKSTSPHA